MSPLVSICLPNLNTRPFLEERMESILAQTVTDWELIVCDSYSDDGAWEYFQKFKGDPRVRLHQVPREGLYAGWNECLRRARGEFVYIATSDDTASGDILERLMRPLVGKPDAKIAVCDVRAVDEEGNEVAGFPSKWPRMFYGDWMRIPHVRNGKTEFILHACLGIMWWSMNAVLFRRNLLEDIGLFRTDRGSQADEEWEMRAALASDIVFIPGKLAIWRVRENQATSKLAPRNRTNLNCLEAVIQDPSSRIPASWRQVPNWTEEITYLCRQEYLGSFGLFRSNLRRPLSFARSLLTAAVREPGFLGRQVARGFAWSAEFSPDPMARAERLVQLFRCSWPPRAL